MYQQTVGSRVDEWMAFLTTEVSLCIGPPDVAVGDSVCVVPGCRLPLILRPDPEAEDEGREGVDEKVLLGWCHANGLMYGEGDDTGKEAVDVILR